MIYRMRPTSDPVAEETSFRAAIAAIDEELRLASEQLAPLAPPTEQALFATPMDAVAQR